MLTQIFPQDSVLVANSVKVLWVQNWKEMRVPLCFPLQELACASLVGSCIDAIAVTSGRFRDRHDAASLP